MARYRFSPVMAAGVMLLAIGCDLGNSNNPQQPAGPATQPPTEVGAVPVVLEEVRDFRDYTGRTEAIQQVDVRARVSGYLVDSPQSRLNSEKATSMEDLPEKVKVSEGDVVEQGQLLMLVDPRPYRLAVQQAKATLAAAEARLTESKQNLSRTQALAKRDAISNAELDTALANVAEIQAQIQNLKAAVERAELDLAFTRVEAPIDGILGNSLVTIGNLVTADSTILSSITSVNPIFVAFDVDEQSLLDYRRRMNKGEVRNARKTTIEVRMGLANESGFRHQGTIDFVASRTDPTTGNTRVRAIFDNENDVLSPGLFARVRVPFTEPYKALLVPTESIGMDQQGNFVMVVKDGQVSRRAIKPGSIHGDKTVVVDGLEEGEMVVTSGLQKIRPGSPVSVAGMKAPEPDEPEVQSTEEITPEENSNTNQ